MQDVPMYNIHFYPAVRAYRRGGRSYFINTHTGTWAALSSRYARAFSEGFLNHKQSKDYYEAYEALSKARIVRDPRYIEKRQNAEIKPLLVKFQTTGKCNLSCIYCFNNTSIRTKTMDRQTMRSAVDYAFTNSYAIHGLYFTIYGGEPLMKRGLLYDTIDYIYNKKRPNISPHINIITNGTLLTAEDVAFLKAREVSISISFDGMPEFQDKNRPDALESPTSDDVIRGIQLLKNYDDMCVLTTVTRDMSEHLLDIALYIQSLGAYYLEFLPLRMLGCAEGQGDISVNASAYIKSLKAIVDAIEAGCINRLGVQAILRMLLPLETGQTLYGELGDRRCGSGRNVISINFDGSITGCDMMPPAFSPFIGDVWKGITNLDKLDKLLMPYGSISPLCNSCPWTLFCRSGCTGASGSDGETCNSRHLLSCAINKEIYPWLLEKLVTDGGILHSYFISHTSRKNLNQSDE